MLLSAGLIASIFIPCAQSANREVVILKSPLASAMPSPILLAPSYISTSDPGVVLPSIVGVLIEKFSPEVMFGCVGVTAETTTFISTITVSSHDSTHAAFFVLNR